MYWIPIYEVLEGRGLEVYLVNAHHLKHVPGRKSDVQDCQWIQQLHSYGLLTASFRPAEDMRVLRAYLRQRAMLLEHRAGHIQHLQKALQQMNVQLTQVLSDISGTTGLQIIRAIVAGERDPQVLARLRHGRCQRSEAEIAKALSGHYRPEHVFALKQALALYDFYTGQVQECDTYIEQHYAAIKPTYDEPLTALGFRPQTQLPCQKCPGVRRAGVLVSDSGRGSDGDRGPGGEQCPSDRGGNRHGYEQVAHREALRLVAGVGPAQRHLGGQGVAQ